MTGTRSPEASLMLEDTHCHLDFDSFDEDRSSVVERARQAGLVRILNPGINLASSRLAVRLAGTYNEVYAAVGVHPNDATTWNPGTRAALKEIAYREKVEEHYKVVAIGEIGLDYYRDHAPHGLQRQVLMEQLDLAAELEIPVVIHNRQAGADIIPILTDWQSGLATSSSPLATRPGVLHSFSESIDVAQEAIELNFFIGITGPVTFRNAQSLQQVVHTLPLTHLLIETDSPFLSPHPYRGQRNEPGRVRLVAEKIAELHQIPLSFVANTTASNADRLFRW